MNNSILKALLTVAVLVSLGLFTLEAKAQVHDCTGGCFVVTCDGDACTLWRCDRDGCRRVTDFHKVGIQSNTAPNQQKSTTAGKPVGSTSGLDCGNQRCAVKVCGPMQCSVFGFEGNQSTLLGSYENIDAILDEIGNAFLERPPRTPELELPEPELK